MIANSMRERDLELRLAEAQSTIDALITGQIDAVVNAGAESPLLVVQAQEALRVERDHAEHYLNTAEVILLALDSQGRITLVNRHACSVLGWSADDLLGRDWLTTCAPEHARSSLADRFARMLDGDLQVYVGAVVTRSGEERLVEWNNTLDRDKDGAVTGTFSSGTDITEQHRALAALKETEERMEFALKSTNVGIWDMDYRSGLIRWSEIVEIQHGVAPGTFAGTFDAFVASIHPDDREASLAIIAQVMKVGGDFTLMYRTASPDEAERWVAGGGHVVLDAEGNPLRALGITQDITERRTMEDQRLQSQRMEAVGRLAGGVAHDFNNILSVILACGDFLLTDLKAMDPSRTDAEEIVKAARRAAQLTQQLLMFSRQQVLAPKLLDLGAVVADMESMLRRVVGEGIEMQITRAENLSRVCADVGSIEQVLMNLTVNAHDAMPTVGKLVFESRDVFVDEALAQQLIGATVGHYVALSVSDTGVGMDASTIAHIFEPFYSTKESGKGTGLGLATVFGIVQQANGAIRVESVPGVGTTFTIYLPRDEGTAHTTEISMPIAIAKGKETILLVEDEAPVRSVARAALQRNGYRVIDMGSPADALLYCEETHEKIDLLMTDVVMPLMNGTELVRRLLEIIPGLKVLYMSGYTDDDMVRNGVMQGAVQFLQKPFSTDSLNRKVREALDTPAALAGSPVI